MTDHRLKMNFALTSFLEGGLEDAVQVKPTPCLESILCALLLFSYASHEECCSVVILQACAALEQKELMEELSESVAAS